VIASILTKVHTDSKEELMADTASGVFINDGLAILYCGEPPVITNMAEGKTPLDTKNIKLAHLSEYTTSITLNTDRLLLVARTLKNFEFPFVDSNADKYTRNASYKHFMQMMEFTVKEIYENQEMEVADIPEAFRAMFTPSGVSRFTELATVPNMNELLKETLEEHMKGIVKGDGARHGEWMKMKAKVARLRTRMENLTPFDPGLTPGELRMLARDDAIVAAGADAGKREEHFANENAVNYSWMMGAIMHIVCDDKDDVEQNVAICRDILRFWAAHGTHTTKSLVTAMSQFPDAVGTAGIDILPLISAIMGHPLWHVFGGEYSETDKLLPNHFITTKRVTRLVSCFGEGQTVWNLGFLDPISVGPSLIELNKEEKDVGFRDRHALSIVWYFAIGRQELINPITDHHDLSGECAIAQMIGSDVRLSKTGLGFPYNWTSGSVVVGEGLTLSQDGAADKKDSKDDPGLGAEAADKNENGDDPDLGAEAADKDESGDDPKLEDVGSEELSSSPATTAELETAPPPDVPLLPTTPPQQEIGARITPTAGNQQRGGSNSGKRKKKK
jgi:hypothetical protein